MPGAPEKIPGPDEDYARLHERILAFVGAFETMQDALLTAVDLHLRKQLPSLGPVLAAQFLARMRDDQRMPCFLAYAEETGYAANLAHMNMIYNRAKQTRDLVGHSTKIAGPVYGLDTWVVSVTSRRSTKRDRVPDPLLPSTFDRLANDCRWIDAHAMRAMYEADTAKFVDLFSGKAAPSPLVPPELPDGGEPL